MKLTIERVYLLVVGELLLQVSSVGGESDSEEAQEEGTSKQQGSWSQWWSYEGISGPDHWDINKRWRLCSLGHKQSPVELRTDRLVYDHLLGPIELGWLEAGSQEESVSQSEKQRPVQVQLLNSGRGIEVWLEEPSLRRTHSWSQNQDQLVLARGPLSYAYKLYKIELHAAATHLDRPLARPVRSHAHAPVSTEEEGSPEAHRSGQSSEHLIDGRAFEAELQLFFYNKHLASSASEAYEQVGLGGSLFAAISVFLMTEEQRKESPLNWLLDHVSQVPHQGNSTKLEVSRAQLERLVPNLQQYITYEGSLNRPPCSEGVQWIIVNQALKVSLQKFQTLFEGLSTSQENIRPVRALNRRQLRTTINMDLQEPPGGRDDCRHNSAHELLNCSSSIGKPEEPGMPACSMRPHYAYQFRYSKLTAATN